MAGKGFGVDSRLPVFSRFAPCVCPCIPLCNWEGWGGWGFFAAQVVRFLGADLPFVLGHLGWLRSEHFLFHLSPFGHRFGFPLCGAFAVMIPAALLVPHPIFLMAFLHFGRKLYK